MASLVEGDTTTSYFYVQRNEGSATNVLELSTAEDTEMDWVDGKLRVKFGSNTATLSGRYAYELRLKLTSGDLVTADSGVLLVNQSIVGQQ